MPGRHGESGLHPNSKLIEVFEFIKRVRYGDRIIPELVSGSYMFLESFTSI